MVRNLGINSGQEQNTAKDTRLNGIIQISYRHHTMHDLSKDTNPQGTAYRYPLTSAVEQLKFKP